MRRYPRLLLPVVCLAVSGILWAGPGFGTIKKRKIDLLIREPAAVRLTNTSIFFRGGSTNPEYVPVQASLLATLETEIISNDRTLVKAATQANAEWLLDIRVTGYSLPNPQTRTQMVGNTPVNMIRWSGSLAAAYQVLDKAGRPHDADNVSYKYDMEMDAAATTTNPSALGRLNIPGLGSKKDAKPAPRTTDDIKQILVKEVVDLIAAKLGNTTKSIELQIAAGDDHLNRAAEFIDQRLWSRAAEELDNTPAYAKPEEESYRQYDLGLVYEGMAYEAKNENDQRQNVYKAEEYYDKALELNHKEKYFVETVARTKEAVARFKAFEQMRRADQKAQRPPVETASVAAPAVGTRAVAPSAAAAPKQQTKALRIGDVLEMTSAGVPEDQVIEVIQSSPVEFNPTDKDTVIAIAKAKLSVRIQNELRKKVGAPLLGQARPPVAAAKPAAAQPVAAPAKPPTGSAQKK